MKYMGHKGKLLKFLGEILLEESRESRAVADPFCGSGVVSWYLAQNTNKIIVSGDLQKFAVCRAAAVVNRIGPIDEEKFLSCWLAEAHSLVELVVNKFPNAEASVEPDAKNTASIIRLVERSRIFCESVLPSLLDKLPVPFPMTRAYGGHYFSPMQALMLDALRFTLPRDEECREVALAALIETASRCAASPGHTAQPFQPTLTSARYILEAWQRPVDKTLSDAVRSISAKHASTVGRAQVMDFKNTIDGLNEGDLVFADPPYSDVHYSRFYHVLETLADGKEIVVSGRGRYPDIVYRPSSNFSLRAQAKSAAVELVETCFKNKVGLVLTFPAGGASNGLSDQDFIALGKTLYSSVEKIEVSSDFSTLGGNAKSRSARLACQESIVCFRL